MGIKFHFLADSKLFSIWNIDKFYGFIKVLFDNIFYFIKCYIKKFTPAINHVQLSIFEGFMQSGLKSWSIIRKDHGMNVKIKGNRGITEFIDSLLRIKTTCHSDLVYIFTKSSDI